MIISASRRTDIPCFYSEWFMNRIKAGRVLTRNPMNRAQVKTVPLTPDAVDCFVFWTKDPLNMLDKLPALDGAGFQYYFQFTLTPYGKDVEKNLRDKNDIERTFIELSRLIGKNRVIWRYDPIILNDLFNIAYHENEFERLCAKLGEHTGSVTISFVDVYAKLRTDLIREIRKNEMHELAGRLSVIARRYGLAAKACCESEDLLAYGVERASCIDGTLIESITGRPLDIKRDKNQREGCGCCSSTDIGAYNTCKNGCVYCYANHSAASINKNAAFHDPLGEFLIP